MLFLVAAFTLDDFGRREKPIGTETPHSTNSRIFHHEFVVFGKGSTIKISRGLIDNETHLKLFSYPLKPPTKYWIDAFRAKYDPQLAPPDEMETTFVVIRYSGHHLGREVYFC